MGGGGWGLTVLVFVTVFFSYMFMCFCVYVFVCLLLWWFWGSFSSLNCVMFNGCFWFYFWRCLTFVFVKGCLDHPHVN